MLIHRARFAGALTAARLLDENVDDVKSAFDIMDEPQPIKGPALTGYYAHVRARLEGRPRRKVERNTYLVLNSDESVDLLLHATNILHIEPDNTVTISFGDDDYKTVTTVGRMNQFLPSGFAISRRYKRGGPGGGTGRRYGTSGEWYTSAVADETTF